MRRLHVLVTYEYTACRYTFAKGVGWSGGCSWQTTSKPVAGKGGTTGVLWPQELALTPLSLFAAIA